MFVRIGLIVALCEIAVTGCVPLPCCMSSQWEAIMGSTDTFISPQSQHVRPGIKYISMDFTNKKMAVATTYMDSPQNSDKFIIDFNVHKQYNIRGNNCTVTEVDFGMQPQCIPSDAVYLGSSYMGSGSSEVPYDAWNYFLSGFKVNISVTVSKANCVPLAELVESSGTDYRSVMMAVFTTFTTGIKNPDVFVPPPSCQQNNILLNVV